MHIRTAFKVAVIKLCIFLVFLSQAVVRHEIRNASSPAGYSLPHALLIREEEGGGGLALLEQNVVRVTVVRKTFLLIDE